MKEDNCSLLESPDFHDGGCKVCGQVEDEGLYFKYCSVVPSFMTYFNQGRIQGGGGLRVLEHPPKLPKVNYLLLLSTYS